MVSSPYRDDLVAAYTTDHFVERELVSRIESAVRDSQSPFILLTGASGTGKSVILAACAKRNAHWLRFFIREGADNTLEDGGVSAFFTVIGHQLSTAQPDLFDLENLEIVVKQRMADLPSGFVNLGISIDELQLSPFTKKVRFDVQQDITTSSAGSNTAIHVGRLYANARLLTSSQLSYLALIEPARALQLQDPDARIVILIDALDEIGASRFRDNNYIARKRNPDVLEWLTTCPELPANITFVLSCRADERLLGQFRAARKMRIVEFKIDTASAEVEEELGKYALALAADERIQPLIKARAVDINDFAIAAARKASGNFQYLAFWFRALLECRDDPTRSPRLLNFEHLPPGLDGIYAHFLYSLKDQVSGIAIEISGRADGRKSYIDSWDGLYKPIIGVLAVASRRLTSIEVHSFAAPGVPSHQVEAAIDRLSPYLEIDRNWRFCRLFHSSLREFVLSRRTRLDHPSCYFEAFDAHASIVNYYRTTAVSWDQVDWHATDLSTEEVAAANLLPYAAYLPTHLHAMKNNAQARASLYALMCKPYFFWKQGRLASLDAFARDLRLADQVAADAGDIFDYFRFLLLENSIAAITISLPPGILATMARIGKSTEALALASLGKDEQYRMNALRLIGNAMVDIGEAKGAREVVREVFEFAVQRIDETFGLMLIIGIAKAMIRLGDGQRLLHAALSYGSARLQCHLALMFAEQGDAEGAERLVNAAAIKKFGDCSPLEECSRAVQAMAILGLREKAEELLQTAIKFAELSQSLRNPELALAFAFFQIPEAVKLIARDVGIMESREDQIPRALAIAGERDMALRFATRTEQNLRVWIPPGGSSRPRTGAHGLVDAFLWMQDSNAIAGLFNQLANLKGSVTIEEACVITQGLARLGRKLDALSLAELIRKALLDDTSSHDTDYRWSELAYGLALAGDVDGANNALEQAIAFTRRRDSDRSTIDRLSTCCSLASALWRGGGHPAWNSFVDKIAPTGSARADLLRAHAEELMAAGNAHDAVTYEAEAWHAIPPTQFSQVDHAVFQRMLREVSSDLQPDLSFTYVAWEILKSNIPDVVNFLNYWIHAVGKIGWRFIRAGKSVEAQKVVSWLVENTDRIVGVANALRRFINKVVLELRIATEDPALDGHSLVRELGLGDDGFQILISEFVRVGDLDRAQHTLSDIQSPEKHLTALIHVATATVIRQGDFGDLLSGQELRTRTVIQSRVAIAPGAVHFGIRLSQTAVDLCVEASDVDDATFQSAFVACARTGNKEGINRLMALSLASEGRLTPGVEGLKALLETGAIELAIALNSRYQYASPDVVSSLLKKGLVFAAEAIASSLQNPKDSISALTYCWENRWRAGDFVAANRIANKLLPAFDSVPMWSDSTEDAACILRVAAVLYSRNRLKEAERIWANSLRNPQLHVWRYIYGRVEASRMDSFHRVEAGLLYCEVRGAPSVQSLVNAFVASERWWF